MCIRDRYKTVACEIPFLSRCIDMVLISSNNEVSTIEFKLEKWRNAIGQAYDHMRGADYAYICMPKRKPSGQMVDELKQLGIGLMLYDRDADKRNRIQIFLEAPKSGRQLSGFKTELVNMTYNICEI